MSMLGDLISRIVSAESIDEMTVSAWIDTLDSDVLDTRSVDYAVDTFLSECAVHGYATMEELAGAQLSDGELQALGLSVHKLARERAQASSPTIGDTFKRRCAQHGLQTVEDLRNAKLTESDLKELGIMPLKARKAVHAAVEKLAAGKDGERQQDSILHAAAAGVMTDLGAQLAGDAEAKADRLCFAASKLVAAVERSEVLSCLRLEAEEAVVDFVVDQLLADLRLVECFGTVGLLAVGGAVVHGGRLDGAAKNVRAVCMLPMARRGGGCLGHAAAQAGSDELVGLWGRLVAAGGKEWNAWAERRGAQVATDAAPFPAPEMDRLVLRVLGPLAIVAAENEDWAEKMMILDLGSPLVFDSDGANVVHIEGGAPRRAAARQGVATNVDVQKGVVATVGQSARRSRPRWKSHRRLA
eukprot:SAG11_NODE_1472_length_4841_cov_2.468157_3_plen_413_part_00